jgi:hypothetical protein
MITHFIPTWHLALFLMHNQTISKIAKGASLYSHFARAPGRNDCWSVNSHTNLDNLWPLVLLPFCTLLYVLDVVQEEQLQLIYIYIYIYIYRTIFNCVVRMALRTELHHATVSVMSLLEKANCITKPLVVDSSRGLFIWYDPEPAPSIRIFTGYFLDELFNYATFCYQKPIQDFKAFAVYFGLILAWTSVPNWRGLSRPKNFVTDAILNHFHLCPIVTISFLKSTKIILPYIYSSKWLIFETFSHKNYVCTSCHSNPTHCDLDFPVTANSFYEGVTKSFRTESITKYMLTKINTRWEASQRVMAA